MQMHEELSKNISLLDFCLLLRIGFCVMHR